MCKLECRNKPPLFLFIRLILIERSLRKGGARDDAANDDVTKGNGSLSSLRGGTTKQSQTQKLQLINWSWDRFAKEALAMTRHRMT
jgi:hypothetical protein